MRSYFLMIILIANSLSAIFDSNKQPIPNTKDITIGPPPGKGRLIRQAQEQAYHDGTLKPSYDGPNNICKYGTIGIGSVVCVSLILYAATLTKMSMSIY